MGKIRHLIWDVDGTLFDTYPAFLRAFSQALESLGHPTSEEQIEPLARVSLPHCAEVMAGKYNLGTDETLERFLHFYRMIPQLEQPPFPGVRKLCELVMTSGGMNVIVTHRRHSTTQELLEVHGLGNLFSGIAGGDDGFEKKPHPAAFLAMMAQHGLAAAETATIGDREIDMAAGRAAGITTCLFSSGDLGMESDFSFSEYGQLAEFLQLG